MECTTVLFPVTRERTRFNRGYRATYQVRSLFHILKYTKIRGKFERRSDRHYLSSCVQEINYVERMRFRFTFPPSASSCRGCKYYKTQLYKNNFFVYLLLYIAQFIHTIIFVLSVKHIHWKCKPVQKMNVVKGG